MAALAPFLAHAATLVVWSGRKGSSGLPGSSLQDCVRVHVCWHLLPYKLTCACKCMSVDPCPSCIMPHVKGFDYTSFDV